MTSIPKALKFLRAHYPTLVSIYESMTVETNKVNLILYLYHVID